MSALATIFGSLGELSESELRQLYLAIGVRLGIPDVPPGAMPQARSRGKSSNTKPSAGKSRKTAPFSGGNPQRKSQWANHPLYREYSRLKKVVEAQAKERKLSFNAVDTTESCAYRTAFSQWLEAKYSFRDHGESGQSGALPQKEEDEEESSSEEEGGGPSAPPKSQVKLGSPRLPQTGDGKSVTPPRAATGKSRASPRNGKSVLP